VSKKVSIFDCDHPGANIDASQFNRPIRVME
jgi:hypothetical protein